MYVCCIPSIKGPLVIQKISSLFGKRLLRCRRSAVSRFIKHMGSAWPSWLLLREFPDMVLCMPRLGEGSHEPWSEQWQLKSTHTLHISGLQPRTAAVECYFLSQAICIIRVPSWGGQIKPGQDLLTREGISQHLSLLVHTGLQTMSKLWIWNCKQPTATSAKHAGRH